MSAKRTIFTLLITFLLASLIYAQNNKDRTFFITDNQFDELKKSVPATNVLYQKIEELKKETLPLAQDKLNAAQKNVNYTTYETESGKKYKEEYHYDNNLNLDSYICSKWDGTQWIQYSRCTITYNSFNNISNSVQEQLINGEWSNTIREQYSYNKNQQLVSLTKQVWDGTQWLQNSYDVLVYDPEGNLILRDSELYGASIQSYYSYDRNNNLVLSQVILYDKGEVIFGIVSFMVYDSNNNLIIEVLDNIDNTSLSPNMQYTYKYDSHNNVTTKYMNNWDSASNNWVNSSYSKYEYDANNNVILTLNHHWKDTDNSWHNYKRDCYEYDEFKNLTLHSAEKWNDGQWNNYCRYIYNFDEEGDPTGAQYEQWNNNSWNLTDTYFEFYAPTASRYQFYFDACKLDVVYNSSITDVTEEMNVPMNFSLAQNYPNPFNPTTTISYTIPESGYVKLKVYNTLGKEVACLVEENQNSGQHKVTFNAGGLSSGIYFYRLECGNFISTKKLTLLK